MRTSLKRIFLGNKKPREDINISQRRIRQFYCSTNFVEKNPLSKKYGTQPRLGKVEMPSVSFSKKTNGRCCRANFGNVFKGPYLK